MTFKFLNQPLLLGRYEPEGIYLHAPLDLRLRVVQLWGEHAEFYARYQYNGIPLKGHVGIDFGAPIGTTVLAVAGGRVIEQSYEPNGFGQYVKLEHAWGESLYAHLEEVLVDAGQFVKGGERIAHSGDGNGAHPPHLHFGVRVKPFNRYDGWGGFTDPLPFLSNTDLDLPDDYLADEPNPFAPPAMAVERAGMRRP